MKLSRRVATRAMALVATGGVVLGVAATALAAPPPYEPDATNQNGQLLFYDTSGNLVTSGNISDDNFARFAVATSDDPISTNTTATLYAYTPQPVGSNSGTWSGEALTGGTTFPVAAPANVAAAGAHRPVVTIGKTTDTPPNINLAGYIADIPNTNSAGSGWENLYQIRLRTPGNTKYWAADIQVTPATGAWTLVYPSLAATTTTLTATPASPQAETTPGAGAPNAITLKATVTDNATGSVVFKDTDTNTTIATQALPGTGAGNNFVTTTVPAGLAVGSHHYSASYSPAVGALFNSSSNSLTYQVTGAPADVTTTSLTANPTSGTVGDTITLTSHVADTTNTSTVPGGSVTWKEGSTVLAGPTTVNGSGDASASGTFGLAAGNHSIVAFYTPTGNFTASQSSPVVVTLSPAAGDPCNNAPTTAGDNSTRNFPNDARSNTCTDDQVFQATVPAGALYISTPYTSSTPFNLGTLQLDSNGVTLHASSTFGTTSNPSNGVTIIDTRAGGLGWTAQVRSTDFSAGPSKTINACNLGFTEVAPKYISGNAIDGVSKVVATTSIANAGSPGVAPGTSCSTGLAGSAHTFASMASNGAGSVNIIGNMDLYAPTSTPAGLYTATVTFTIF